MCDPEVHPYRRGHSLRPGGGSGGGDELFHQHGGVPVISRAGDSKRFYYLAAAQRAGEFFRGAMNTNYPEKPQAEMLIIADYPGACFSPFVVGIIGAHFLRGGNGERVSVASFFL